MTVLARAAAAAGLPSTQAEPIRIAENETWKLLGGVIARITKPGQLAAAAREVAVARWLADQSVPTVRPLEGVDQPVSVDGRAVTFWHELPAHRPGTVLDVVRLLKRLHSLPLPDFLVGQLDPFVRLAERIDASELCSEVERTWLHERVRELRSAWDLLPVGLPRCIVHGDAWTGNTALTEDGTTYLLDLERCSVGPPEWDLVSTAVKISSVGGVSRREYHQYTAAYGFDVMDWPGYPTMRDIRELRMTSYALQHANDHPQSIPEARYRLDCLLGLNGPRPWSWTAVT
ncbi:phosphotransferase family protein [Streptomyces sp. NPDC059631]|uniref:phosphotransferase family protein n=1 Tax=unclassified Streptomyces TaxID=2593676 RepID=UPI0036761D4C